MPWYGFPVLYETILQELPELSSEDVRERAIDYNLLANETAAQDWSAIREDFRSKSPAGRCIDFVDQTVTALGKGA